MQIYLRVGVILQGGALWCDSFRFVMISNKLAVKHEVRVVCFNRRACRRAVLARPGC